MLEWARHKGAGRQAAGWLSAGLRLGESGAGEALSINPLEGRHLAKIMGPAGRNPPATSLENLLRSKIISICNMCGVGHGQGRSALGTGGCVGRVEAGEQTEPEKGLFVAPNKDVQSSW